MIASRQLRVKKYSNFIKDENLLVKPNYYSKKFYQTNCNICQVSCENLRKSLSNYDKCSEVAIHFIIIDQNDDLILILDPDEGHFGRNASINKITFPFNRELQRCFISSTIGAMSIFSFLYLVKTGYEFGQVLKLLPLLTFLSLIVNFCLDNEKRILRKNIKLKKAIV
ncbi:hypothetical protein BpHYR1_025461 [Brachionus plicatilis]|uniref:Uncharacterized protein n=1 Tax=Brachionus plicatilis TaxID=10195 RepID=A0A3M7RSS1_BRAPC|nr:hypothetical protein BpHYR1_025461 [Brachionus plicatilis]